MFQLSIRHCLKGTSTNFDSTHTEDSGSVIPRRLSKATFAARSGACLNLKSGSWSSSTTSLRRSTPRRACGCRRRLSAPFAGSSATSTPEAAKSSFSANQTLGSSSIAGTNTRLKMEFWSYSVRSPTRWPTSETGSKELVTVYFDHFGGGKTRNLIFRFQQNQLRAFLVSSRFSSIYLILNQFRGIQRSPKTTKEPN